MRDRVVPALIGCRSRQRHQADPVESLFRQTGHQWDCERNGLQVFVADGALLRPLDSTGLREQPHNTAA